MPNATPRQHANGVYRLTVQTSHHIERATAEAIVAIELISLMVNARHDGEAEWYEPPNMTQAEAAGHVRTWLTRYGDQVQHYAAEELAEHADDLGTPMPTPHHPSPYARAMARADVLVTLTFGYWPGRRPPE